MVADLRLTVCARRSGMGGEGDHGLVAANAMALSPAFAGTVAVRGDRLLIADLMMASHGAGLRRVLHLDKRRELVRQKTVLRFVAVIARGAKVSDVVRPAGRYRDDMVDRGERSALR